jgi:hypothetical protein
MPNSLLRALLVFTLPWLAIPAAEAEDWYAALSPNNELSAPVAWGKTQQEAMDGALDACRKVSSTCSSRPAWTDKRNEIFALMCCNKPRLGCAVGVGVVEEAAKQSVQSVFNEAGFSSCRIGRYISAKTGEDTGYED